MLELALDREELSLAANIYNHLISTSINLLKIHIKLDIGYIYTSVKNYRILMMSFFGPKIVSCDGKLT